MHGITGPQKYVARILLASAHAAIKISVLLAFGRSLKGSKRHKFRANKRVRRRSDQLSCRKFMYDTYVQVLD